MPKIIALAQQKGGVGKSTLAIHMAVELTARNRLVAIIDLDPQGTVTNWKRRRAKDWPQVIAGEPAKLGTILAGLG